MTKNGVVDGWERTADGYRQTATMPTTALAPAKPVNGQQLIDAWRELTAAHTAAIPRQAQVVDGDSYGRGNGLSSASELAERRATSKMYLLAYVLMTSGTIAGLVALAAITGVIGDNSTAFAAWLAGTGIVSLGLAAWQHRRELALTPESLEELRINSDYAVSEVDAQSRQLLAQAHADAIRLQAQAALEDAQARRLAAQTATQAAMAAAQRQISMHEAPQSEYNALANYRKPLQTATAIPRAELPIWTPESAQQAAIAPQVAIVDTARRKLLDFVLSAYSDGAFDSDGYLRKGVVSPLSARSGLTPTERTQAQDLLQQLANSGSWLLRYDESRKTWQLNTVRYTNSAQAIEALGATVTR